MEHGEDSRYTTALSLEVLTMKEVADYLRVNIATVYRLLKNGKLPGRFRIGGSWRVDRAALLEWIENGGNGQNPIRLRR